MLKRILMKKIVMMNKSLLKFKGTPTFMVYTVFPVFLFSFLLLFIVVFFNVGLFGKLISSGVAIYLLKLILTGLTLEASFSANDLYIKTMSRKKIKFSYEEIIYFRENIEWPVMYTVIVVKFRDKSKIWKGHMEFYCPPSKGKELDDFLKEKGFVIEKMK